MNLFPYQRDARQYRFPLPNEIWTWKLKPPAFAVLAYLQYRHCRKFGGTATPEELAEHTRMSSDPTPHGSSRTLCSRKPR